MPIKLSDATSLQLTHTANHYNTTVDNLIVKLLQNEPIYSFNPEDQHINEHIKLAISAAHLGIWTLDVASGVLEWNDELLTIYGITREEFNHQLVAWQERVHPEDREYAQARLNKAFLGERVLDVPFRIVYPNGEIRYVMGAATPIMQDGKVIKIIGNNLDVTKIMHAQQLIIHQTAILENLSDAVIITDLDFRVISWNKRAEALYGFSADEVQNKSVGSLLQTIYPDGSNTTNAYEQFRAQGYWQGEVIQFTRTGEQIFVSSAVTLIHGDATTPPMIAAFNRDITQRKNAEKLEVEQEILRRSIEQERQTSAFRAKMLTTLAHEFRTPLAIIQTSSEILVNYSDRITEDRKKVSKENIFSQIAHITRMLDDLRLIARSQRQSLVLKLEEVETDRLVNTLIANLTTTLKPQQTLKVNIEGALGRIHLDPQLIQIALSNLISNAVKYSPDNGHIEINIYKTADDLILAITDHGMGIPEADQQYLFEPFFRAKNAGDISGSGLGLSIVSEIAQLHRGSIICESSIGVGSTFTLRLSLSIQ